MGGGQGSCSQGAWLGMWLRLTFGAVGHFIQVVESDPVQEILLHQLMEEYIQTTVITNVHVCVCVCKFT